MLSSANQSSNAHSKDFSNSKYEIASLDVLTRSQADFMNKLLEKVEISKVTQTENEERMLRLLADSSKSSQAENEERMLRLLADSSRRGQVELASYFFAGLFIL
eukprot:gene9429-12604_t